MKYVFLNNKFFAEFDQVNYPEIERKDTRPYILIKITINGITFGLPLRSGISHPNVYWTNKPKHCGVDYSKAVIIPDKSYIDTTRPPHIRPDEFKKLLGKEYIIQTEFEKYIEEYKQALSTQHIQRYKELCTYSTLQYYHIELNIV